MGCFDYECACGGTECGHEGGQNCSATVIIKVTLSDGTAVYLEGEYEQYGYVTVDEYQFWPVQFEDYFESWLDNEKDTSKIFLSQEIWTVGDSFGDKFRGHSCFPSELTHLSKFDSTHLSNYVRVESESQFKERQAKEAERRQARIVSLQKELERLTSSA